MNKIQVTISNKNYDLLLAISEEEKEKGLQDVEEMDDNEGMFFDYRDDIQEELSFWMKDTYIPLDIIFVNSSNNVISVRKGIPESEELLTEHNVAYVIEVNQNSGIKSGDSVKFKSKIEQDNEVEETEEPETAEGVMEIIGSDGEVQAQLQGSERIFSIKHLSIWQNVRMNHNLMLIIKHLVEKYLNIWRFKMREIQSG